IRLPAKPPPRRARNRTIRSAGPSSLASRCVTRQVARAARTNRAQKPNSSKRSAFEIVADTDRPERLRPVGIARGNSSVLDPQPKPVIAALATWQQQISGHGIRYLRTAHRIDRSQIEVREKSENSRRIEMGRIARTGNAPCDRVANPGSAVKTRSS